MSLQARIAAARAHRPDRYLGFEVDGQVVGRVRRDLAVHLATYARVFDLGERIRFKPAIRDLERRSAAMEDVAHGLAQAGLLTGWRSETYAVAAEGGEPLFHLERAAVRFFGFRSQAVHVNGLSGDGRSLWIARRSPDKQIDPGKFDTLVGGGIGNGFDRESTLVKEAWEEAGIDAGLARRAMAIRCLDVCHDVPDGLHCERIHAYDLLLPDGFVPQNQDGEVAGFRCVALEAVRCELEGDAPYTVDAGLVTLDCLVRRGVVAASLNNPD